MALRRSNFEPPPPEDWWTVQPEGNGWRLRKGHIKGPKFGPNSAKQPGDLAAQAEADRRNQAIFDFSDRSKK